MSISLLHTLYLSLSLNLSVSLVKSLPPSLSFSYSVLSPFHILYTFTAYSTSICTCNVNPPAVCLETGVQSDQEGMVGGLLKHMLLSLDPVNVLYIPVIYTNTHTVKCRKVFYGVLQTVHIYSVYSTRFLTAQALGMECINSPK